MSILMGVLLILGAFALLQFPVIAGTVMCWVLIGFILVFGIISIIRFFGAKKAEKVAEKNGKSILGTGIGSLILGIAAVIVALVTMSTDVGAAVFGKIVCTMFGAVIVLIGVSFIVRGFQLKRIAASGWVGVIIMGGLIVVSGVFCIVSVFTSLVAMGTMYAVAMMISGVTCVLSR